MLILVLTEMKMSCSAFSSLCIWASTLVFAKPSINLELASILPVSIYQVLAQDTYLMQSPVMQGHLAWAIQPPHCPRSFFRAFSLVTSHGKEKALALSTGMATETTTLSATCQTNVFPLVEWFTFRPSSTETDLANPPPKLPPEIQYWVGVIMRNACQKDNNWGGIRQCTYNHPFNHIITFWLISIFSALWSLGNLSSWICKMLTVQEGQIL